MLRIPYRLVFVNLLGNLLIVLANLVRLPRAMRRPRWVVISISEPTPARPGRKRRFFGRGPRSLAEIAKLCDELAGDDRLEGVVVHIESLSGGWARLAALRAAIARLRGADKRVVAHLSGGGLRAYYVACAANQIVIDESAPLGLNGLAAEATFWAGALDKAGIRAQLEYRGAYKSMAETFTRRDMSEAHREAIDALLDRIEAELVRAVADGRGVDAERAAELITGGPYAPAEAEVNGLVDAVEYRDQLPEWLKLPRNKLAREAGWRRSRLRPLRWKSLLLRRRIVRVISLHGTIVTGEGTDFPRTMLGAKAACRELSAARTDRRTAAVVLHVDSRGGSAQASDLIWREVVRLGADKPVIAYFDDVAASGGYYLACAAHAIVAQPLSVTGSIGVVGGKMSLAGLYDRFGVSSVILTRGEAAAMNHPSRDYSEEERRRLRAEIDAMYEQFVRKVADGRKMELAAADTVAQGRVWSGHDAHERGLVDELGSVDTAIELAKQKARRRPGEKLEVRDEHATPKVRSLLGRALANSAELSLPPAVSQLAELSLLAGERTLLLPDLDVRWP